jgi:hypothetical protein
MRTEKMTRFEGTVDCDPMWDFDYGDQWRIRAAEMIFGASSVMMKQKMIRIDEWDFEMVSAQEYGRRNPDESHPHEDVAAILIFRARVWLNGPT